MVLNIYATFPIVVVHQLVAYMIDSDPLFEGIRQPARHLFSSTLKVNLDCLLHQHIKWIVTFDVREKFLHYFIGIFFSNPYSLLLFGLTMP